jgi:arylsulfatase A-like enzyme
MSKEQPNILLISCDHLRADLLGCAGHPIIQTPNIDLLAQNGVRFDQAYSTTPICIPARSTIMAGQEGHELGITEFVPGFEIPVEETLPKQLGDAGYQTRAVGKMHFFPERRHYGFDSMLLCEEGRTFGKPYGENRGYDDYEQWLADQGYAGEAFSHGVPMNGYATSPWQLPDNLHPTEWIGSQACKEIKRRDWTRPLFMWTSFTAPHPPLVPLMKDLYIYDKDKMPKPHIGDWIEEHPSFHELYLDQKTDKEIDLILRSFYALVTQIDRQISRILGTLREQGMLENTWIIFTSDHGDSLGDHNLWRKTKFLRGATNIPLIVTPPLNKESLSEYMPNTINTSVVGLQDILSTCMDIAGADIPNHVTGKSLFPLIKDASCSVRETILGEVGPVRGRSFMLTDGIWKYLWYEEDGSELLFNIQDDPNEINNLLLQHCDVHRKFKDQLEKTLSLREGDPAIKDGRLAPKSLGLKLTSTEIAERLRFYPYDIPVGQH